MPVNVTDGNPTMTLSPRRLRAAFLLVALGVTASPPIGSPLGLGASALAQGKSVEVPASRQLGASGCCPK
jgi:hypothetical protein